jgi:hypothetical protein
VPQGDQAARSSDGRDRSRTRNSAGQSRAEQSRSEECVRGRGAGGTGCLTRSGSSLSSRAKRVRSQYATRRSDPCSSGVADGSLLWSGRVPDSCARSLVSTLQPLATRPGRFLTVFPRIRESPRVAGKGTPKAGRAGSPPGPGVLAVAPNGLRTLAATSQSQEKSTLSVQ